MEYPQQLLASSHTCTSFQSTSFPAGRYLHNFADASFDQEMYNKEKLGLIAAMSWTDRTDMSKIMILCKHLQ